MGKTLVACAALAICGLAFAAKDSTAWTTTKLNDQAVTDEGGQMVVLGTEGSYNDAANATRAAVFDGDTATFFDPSIDAAAMPCWAGFELAEARCVTRIRYFGRADYKERMNGCLFQGANSADFSDAVTLHVASAADGWDGTHWADVFVAGRAALQPFKYLRILAPNPYPPDGPGTWAGNAAEVEFYGVPAANFDTFTKDPQFPASYLVSQYLINNHYTFGVAWSSRVPFYEVQRKPAASDDTAWVDCGAIPFLYDGYTSTSTTGYFFRDPTPVYEPTDYRVRAYSPTKGTSDWFDLGTQDPGCVAEGTWIGPTGSWGDENSTATNGEKAYDGNIDTFVDLPSATNKGGWTGLDLGRSLKIIGAKAVARNSDWYARLNDSVVQVASDPNFTDAVTMGTFTGATRTGVVSLTFETPVEARYVRVKAADGVVFNLSEFEVDLSPEPQYAPAVSVAMSDLENEYAVLSWADLDLGRYPREAIVVYRSNSRQGPWTEFAVLDKTATTLTDDTLLVGPLYCYAVCYRLTIDGQLLEGPRNMVGYHRGHRLDRGADETTLLAGITPVCNGTPWGGGSVEEMKLKPFDGDLGSFPDSNENDAYIGLDFGSPVGVTAVRVYPRQDQVGRLNGAMTYGMNDLAEWRTGETPATPLTEAVAVTEVAWSTAMGTSDGEFRYVVLGRESGAWNCNVNEIQVYGWTPDEAQQILQAPANLVLAQPESGLTLTWSPVTQAASYTVRRKVNDGDWADVATGVASPSYVDADAIYNGNRYTYQVAAVGADGTSCLSKEVSAIPYHPGYGTGLYGVYLKNYKPGYDPTETVAFERVDPTIDFNWGENAPDARLDADNFGAVWTGQLIVPFTGDYVLTADHDNGFRLQIDGKDVINNWSNWGNAYTTTVVCPLDGGEHDIRIDYCEVGGAARCRLSWGGAVTPEVIPATQFVPAKVADTVPAPWKGMRAINGTVLGGATFAGDGSVLLSSGGHDIWGDQEGFCYLWQTVKGDFEATVKVDLANVPSTIVNQRGMLMLRSALAAGEPMFLVQVEGGKSTPRLNCKARAGTQADGVNVADVLAWTETGAANVCWFKLRRTRGTIAVSTRTDPTAEWAPLYTYEIPDGLFGDKVLIGPAQGAGSQTPGNLSYGRFSEFKLTPLNAGTAVLFR